MPAYWAQLFDPLTDANYEGWSRTIKALLVYDDLWDIVAGRTVAPTVHNDSVTPELMQYFVRSTQALLSMHLSMSPVLRDKHMHILDPAVLWSTLKSNPSTRNQPSRHGLRRKLFQTKLRDCGTVAAFVARMSEILDAIAAAVDEPNVSATEHCFYLLNGLPDELDGFLKTVEYKVKVYKPEILIAALVEYEKKKRGGMFAGSNDTLLFFSKESL